MLNAIQLQQRDGKLTASRVACLMTGDETKIMNLWRELVGDPAFMPEDLSDIWPVQLGSATEAVNLSWYARKHGAISRIGEVVLHRDHDWAACTLDGWCNTKNCPIECKHVGGREARETVIERYQPQFHWQMIVTGARTLRASIIEGANEPTIEEIPFNADYAAELWHRAEAFMECVRSLTPPVTLAPVASPVIPVKIVDMTGNNSWSANSATWITTKQAATDNKAAEKELKAIVPADAARAHGHGVTISRDKAGRLSLRENAK